MSKVIDEFHISKYTVLILDKIPPKNYSYFLIGGEKYVPVPIYDARNCIAVSRKNEIFIGKEVEFI